VIGTDSPSGFTLTITASTCRPVQLAFRDMPDRATLRAQLTEGIPLPLYYDDMHGRPDWRRHMTLEFAEEIRQELADRRP
jgi:hypothetical protein